MSIENYESLLSFSPDDLMLLCYAPFQSSKQMVESSLPARYLRALVRSVFA